MGWCTHCDDDCPTVRDPDKGYICCALCGRIIDEDIYFTGPTFAKDSSGQSRFAGSIMHSVQSGYSASHERTLMKGRDEIRHIVDSLRVGGGDSIINKAHAFYQIAVDKNFTKGRRTSQVAAACLYIACRQTKKAYLLIDFSDYLQINVYVLGAVFLQLCKTLSLLEHPIVQKLVDPSLFIHRFTERLLGRKNNAVSETALRIIARMKRDWMQTGRKPSGLCGAALYISAHSHGLKYSKIDVVSVVHVCEATLTKRLIEFENTESGSLTVTDVIHVKTFLFTITNQLNVTNRHNNQIFHISRYQVSRSKKGHKVAAHSLLYVLLVTVHMNVLYVSYPLCKNDKDQGSNIEEFLATADELNAESELDQLPKAGKVLCKHKDSEVPHFAHGLCRKCYDKFIKISGGLQGGAEPPAFQQAERRRMEKEEKEKKMRDTNLDNHHTYEKSRSIHDKENGSAKIPDIGQAEGKTTNDPESAGSAGDNSLDSEQQDLDDTADDETENFSDIDDVEVNGYLHNEEEKELKKIIWEEMNKEYLEEQAAKEAAVAAAKEAYEANFADGTEDVLAAKELAEATAAALAKSRKERKKRRAEESKNAAPAQTPLEATRQMLKKKTFSSKVNYEALEALYTSEQDNGKKQKIESDAADPCNLHDNIENHGVDPGATEDGDGPEEFEDHNFAEVSYDDYNEIGDEDYGYDEDFDFS
ncbi:unnamed protein product [Musa hybrid cultivar]